MAMWRSLLCALLARMAASATAPTESQVGEPACSAGSAMLQSKQRQHPSPLDSKEDSQGVEELASGVLHARTLDTGREGRATKTGSPCDALHKPSGGAYQLEKPGAEWYSQIGQDARLERSLPNGTRGFFIESGAADGELNSNSLHFEKRGWTGLLVEPDPHTFGMLVGKNRKSFAYPGALSTTGQRGTMYLRMKDCAGYRGDGECSEVVREPGPHTLAVPVTPLEELLACLGRTTVDFWSLDVEGVESMIMKHFPFDKVEVGLMLIEMNKSEENNKGIEGVMANAGFRECGRTELDRFYANPSYFKKRGLDVPSAC